MSLALYEFGGLRFWEEQEIELRELFQQRVVSTVKRTLLKMNSAWKFYRIEGPILTPKIYTSDSYTENDVFKTNHELGDNYLRLRAETTASSYLYAEKLKEKLPLCVWQSGKSFRRELSDGATAAKLRFNEFYQLEFQCIYSVSTKADYRSELMENVGKEIKRFTNSSEINFIDSDRLPYYSDSTIDIELKYKNEWKEVASCSIRNDYSELVKVCEIAIGLDRIVEIANENML